MWSLESEIDGICVFRRGEIQDALFRVTEKLPATNEATKFHKICHCRDHEEEMKTKQKNYARYKDQRSRSYTIES